MTLAAQLAAYPSPPQSVPDLSSSSASTSSPVSVSELNTPIDGGVLHSTRIESPRSPSTLSISSSYSHSASSSSDARSYASEPACVTSKAILSLAPFAPPPRRNEHLAVLLPKDLWKPDAQASKCEAFPCRKRFSLFERRHHCRKCGGVYCADCTPRTTPLLDTTNLPFLHPPRGTSIFAYASPTSPIHYDARICNYCWAQFDPNPPPPSAPTLNTQPKSVSRKLSAASLPIALASSSSSSISSTSAISTPPDGLTPLAHPLHHHRRPPLSRSQTAPRLKSASASTFSTPHSQLGTPPATILESDSQSQSETPTPPANSTSNSNTTPTPHRRSSHPHTRRQPKLSFGPSTNTNLWTPKPINLPAAHRPPGGKARFEIEMEEEEERKRIWRLNPVLIDGDFQIRVPRQFAPSPPVEPYEPSNF